MTKLKIFRVDDCSWYVAHNLMEFLNWYHKNIDTIENPDDLMELKEINPEEGTMWSDRNITPDDIDSLGDSDEIGRDELGSLQRRYGEIFKKQTFAEVLGDEDINEPYEIASTEW